MRLKLLSVLSIVLISPTLTVGDSSIPSEKKRHPQQFQLVGSELFRHPMRCEFVCFSSERGCLYTLQANDALAKWNLDAKRRDILPARLRNTKISWLGIFNDENLILYYDLRDHAFHTYDFSQDKVTWSLYCLNWSDRLVERVAAWSVQSQILTYASSISTAKSRLHIWNLRLKKCVSTIDVKGLITTVTISTDGRFVAFGNNDRTIQVYNIFTNKLLWTAKFGDGPISAATFSNNGKLLAVGETDGVVALFEIETGNQLTHFVSSSRKVQSLSFALNDELLVIGNAFGGATAWSVSKRRKMHQLGPIDDNYGCHQLSVSTCGKYLATAGYVAGYFDLTTGSVVLPETAHREPPVGLTFGADGRTLFSASTDNRIGMWDLKRNALRCWRDHGGRVLCIVSHPQDKTFASAGVKTPLRLWDETTQSPTRTIALPTTTIYAACYSPDGNQVAVGGQDGTISIVNNCTHRIMKPFRGRDPVQVLKFDNTGKQLIASTHCLLAICCVESGKLLSTVELDHTCDTILGISADGRLLAAASQREVRVVQVPSGKLQKSAEIAKATTGMFLPDSQGLIVGSKDGFVQNIDLRQDVTYQRIDCDRGEICCLACTRHHGGMLSVGTKSTSILLIPLSQLLQKTDTSG